MAGKNSAKYGRRDVLKAAGSLSMVPVGATALVSEARAATTHHTNSNETSLGENSTLRVESDLQHRASYQIDDNTWGHDVLLESYGAVRDGADDRRAVIDFHSASVEWYDSSEMTVNANEDDPETGAQEGDSTSGEAGDLAKSGWELLASEMDGFTDKVLSYTNAADAFLDFVTNAMFDTKKIEFGWNYDTIRYADVSHQMAMTMKEYEPLAQCLVTSMVQNLYVQWEVTMNDGTFTTTEPSSSSDMTTSTTNQSSFVDAGTLSRSAKRKYGIKEATPEVLDELGTPQRIRELNPKYVATNYPLKIRQIPSTKIKKNSELGY